MPDGRAPFRDDGVDARLIPPGVADARAQAFTEVLGRAIDELPLDRFGLVDFDRVDAKLLSDLVRGLTMQKFMFEGIPETVVRRLLANAIPLHVTHGTAAGIKLGLRMIGMRLKLLPWHAETPRAAPNTYKATIYVNEQLFDDPKLLSEANQRAALTMVDATKRWSQLGTLTIGVGFDGTTLVANAATAMAFDRREHQAAPNVSRRSEAGLAGAAASMVVDRRTHAAAPSLLRRSSFAAAGAMAAMAVHRQSFVAEPA